MCVSLYVSGYVYYAWEMYYFILLSIGVKWPTKPLISHITSDLLHEGASQVIT